MRFEGRKADDTNDQKVLSAEEAKAEIARIQAGQRARKEEEKPLGPVLAGDKLNKNRDSPCLL